MRAPRLTEPVDASTPWERDTDPARQAFLEAVVDATLDAVFRIDAGGMVSSWNRSAERIFGWTESEVIGEPVATLFADDVRATIEWFLDIVTSGDRIEQFETDVERKGGMPTPISLTLVPITGSAGPIGGAAAVARDLTEQRLAQATLAETETRVREGEALAHVGRWMWDTGSGTVQWSEELHRIHGIEPPDFEGDLDAHVAAVVPADRQRVVEALARAVAQGRPFEAEYDIVRPDAEVRHLYARAEPTIGPNGVVLGLRGIVHDSSARGGAG
jgi:PAS domain S-box-containing protein